MAYVFGQNSAIFLTNRTDIFYGNYYLSIGDYYLSIGVNKSQFWALFAIFDFLGPKEVRGPYESGASKPIQKVVPLGGILGHRLSRNHVSNFSDLKI